MFNNKMFVSIDKIGLNKETKIRKGQKGLHDTNYLKHTFLDYITRGSACLIQNEIDNDKLIEEFNKLNTEEKVKAKDFLKRYTKDNQHKKNTENHSGLFSVFTDERIELDKETVQSKINNEIRKKNSFYEMVISMGELTHKNLIFSSEEIRKRVSYPLQKFLKESYYKNIDGFYTIHSNTDNVHLHLLIWDDNKKINVYNKKSFEELKSNLFNAFSDREFLFKQQEMFETSKEMFEYKLDIKEEIFTSIDFSNENQSSSLFNKVNTLKMLFNKNKKTYKNLSNKEKKIVKDIHKELIKENENYAKFYNEWEIKISELRNCNFENQAINEEFRFKVDKEVNEIKQSVYNKIIKTFIDDKKTYTKIEFNEIYKNKKSLINDSEIEYLQKRKDFQALKNYLSNFESSSLDNNMLNNIWE